MASSSVRPVPWCLIAAEVMAPSGVSQQANLPGRATAFEIAASGGAVYYEINGVVAAVYESGALHTKADYMVMAANVYDSLIGGGDYLQTDATQIEGSDATDQIADAVLDEVFEGTMTLREFLSLMAAFSFGESDGGGLNYYSLDGLTARLQFTISGSNRTNVTRNPV